LESLGGRALFYVMKLAVSLDQPADPDPDAVSQG
jgi:hypothetical protein